MKWIWVRTAGEGIMPDSDVHCVIINLHFCTPSLSLATLICCPWRRTLITVLWSSCCGTTCHSFIICFKPLLPLAAHSDLADQQLFYSAIYIKDLSSNICLSPFFLHVICNYHLKDMMIQGFSIPTKAIQQELQHPLAWSGCIHDQYSCSSFFFFVSCSNRSGP